MVVFSAPVVKYWPSNLLTGSPPPPSPPSLCKYVQVYVFIQCVTEGMGPQADKRLPPSPFTGQFLRKVEI
jgi:hypothetical protein